MRRYLFSGLSYFRFRHPREGGDPAIHPGKQRPGEGGKKLYEIRHSREGGNPGRQPAFKGRMTTWIPAFAGMTCYLNVFKHIYSRSFLEGRQPAVNRFRVSRRKVDSLDSRLRGNDGLIGELNPLNRYMRRVSLFLIMLFLILPILADSRMDVLQERAEKFAELGLLSLARAQYKYMVETYPDNKEFQKKEKEFVKKEIEQFYQNALYAKEVGALQLALAETGRVLKIDSKHKKTKKLKKTLENEIQLEVGLLEQVSKDYLQGIEWYQNKRYDRALASFVKVINMHPNHKGALTYIEKIGHRLSEEGPK